MSKRMSKHGREGRKEGRREGGREGGREQMSKCVDIHTCMICAGWATHWMGHMNLRQLKKFYHYWWRDVSIAYIVFTFIKQCSCACLISYQIAGVLGPQVTGKTISQERSLIQTLYPGWIILLQLVPQIRLEFLQLRRLSRSLLCFVLKS